MLWTNQTDVLGDLPDHSCIALSRKILLWFLKLSSCHFFEGYIKMEILLPWTTHWIMVEIFRTCWDSKVPRCKSLWGFMSPFIGLSMLFSYWAYFLWYTDFECILSIFTIIGFSFKLSYLSMFWPSYMCFVNDVVLHNGLQWSWRWKC